MYAHADANIIAYNFPKDLNSEQVSHSNYKQKIVWHNCFIREKYVLTSTDESRAPDLTITRSETFQAKST